MKGIYNPEIKKDLGGYSREIIIEMLHEYQIRYDEAKANFDGEQKMVYSQYIRDVRKELGCRS